MSSIGGGSWPRVPRKMLVKACWAEVKRRRASPSVSAAMTLTPTIAWGFASCADGSKRAR